MGRRRPQLGLLLVALPAFRYLAGVLMLETSGSVLAVGVLHASFNASGGMDIIPAGWQYVPAVVLLALVVATVGESKDADAANRSLQRRPPRLAAAAPDQPASLVTNPTVGDQNSSSYGTAPVGARRHSRDRAEGAGQSKSPGTAKTCMWLHRQREAIRAWPIGLDVARVSNEQQAWSLRSARWRPFRAVRETRAATTRRPAHAG